MLITTAMNSSTTIYITKLILDRDKKIIWENTFDTKLTLFSIIYNLKSYLAFRSS